MARQNTTFYFGMVGGMAAFIVGYLAIGFHMIYITPVLAAIVTIILFTRKFSGLV